MFIKHIFLQIGHFSKSIIGISFLGSLEDLLIFALLDIEVGLLFLLFLLLKLYFFIY